MGSKAYDWLHPNRATFITDLQSKFQQAGVTISPLVLDLDGDGVETIDKSAGIHFDHDGNGFAETTGWAGKDDGLLVWDRNDNGKIDDGSELFGNQTKLAIGGNADNGFAGLAELDSNYDGVVNAMDAGFSGLRVWMDGDSNALVLDGELLSLDEAGVQSIEVAYAQQSITDTQGNQHLQIGQYTRVDGSTRAMNDVWFAADMARTKDLNTVVVAGDIAALPDLQGFGNVHSLHQAMARDTSGKLQALVRQFTQTADNDKRTAVFDDILYAWTGSDVYAANARGGYFGDARELYALEAFLGQKFVQGSGTNAGTNNPGPNATQVLGEVYGLLSDQFNAQLMAQTHFKDLYGSVELSWNADTLDISVNVSKTLDKLSALYDIDPVQASSVIRAFGSNLKACGDFGKQTLAALKTDGNWGGTGFPRLLAAMGAEYVLGDGGDNEMVANGSRDTILLGMDGNDRLNGNSGNNILDGGHGDDTLFGKAGDDVLHGGAGSDQLNGDQGNDLVVGGAGNDLLYGGIGNDTYVLVRGDGADLISDYDTMAGNIDVVQFTDVASTELTSVERQGNELVMKYGATDQLTMTDYFNSSYPGSRIEQFSFSDGMSWDDAAIKARVITTGYMYNDCLTGYNDGANRIYGLAGNDMLAGGVKDDLIDGGIGNDTLNGRAGDDMLIGGAGDDQLNGGEGNDTYVFARGDGVDMIDDCDTTAGNIDAVQFTDVASMELTSLERRGNELVIEYGATDQLTIKDYFNVNFPGSRKERFSFSDGVSWDDAAIRARVSTTGYMYNDCLTGYDDGTNRIYGLDGNDILAGGMKDDFIDGGTGNDWLYGYAGDDILQGGAGMDILADTTGNNLFNSGTDNDVLNGGGGSEFYIGGAGNDAITTGLGYDLIAFNRGDGQDTVAASTGRDNTLSLGGGIGYADLSLSRSVNNLVLTTGVDESLTFNDWYANPSNQSVANLQMVVEGSSDYDAASSDSLLNQKVAQFDFDAMVSRFDAAQAASPGLSSWSLSSAMLDFHLGSSGTAAIGGDLAYQYGRYGALSGMSVNAAQSLLSGAQFGSASQALQGGAALPDLSPRLM